jgi:hypothetical protein
MPTASSASPTATASPAATTPAIPSSRLPAGPPPHLTPEERRESTTYTSGEHCAMCAAAHAWVGLGRIVYASSTAQLLQWQGELGIPAGPVTPLRIPEVAPGIDVAGPDPELSAEVRALHAKAAGR